MKVIFVLAIPSLAVHVNLVSVLSLFFYVSKILGIISEKEKSRK